MDDSCVIAHPVARVRRPPSPRDWYGPRKWTASSGRHDFWVSATCGNNHSQRTVVRAGSIGCSPNHQVIGIRLIVMFGNSADSPSSGMDTRLFRHSHAIDFLNMFTYQNASELLAP